MNMNETAETKGLFTNICRTCMSRRSQEEQEFSCILECPMELHNLRIMDLLTTAVPNITINSSDNLPKEICQQCLCKALEVHEFQQMCLRSEQELQNFSACEIVEQKFDVSALPESMSAANKRVLDYPPNADNTTQKINEIVCDELKGVANIKLEVDEEAYDSQVAVEEVMKVRLQGNGDFEDMDTKVDVDCGRDNENALEHVDTISNASDDVPLKNLIERKREQKAVNKLEDTAAMKIKRPLNKNPAKDEKAYQRKLQLKKMIHALFEEDTKDAASKKSNSTCSERGKKFASKIALNEHVQEHNSAKTNETVPSPSVTENVQKLHECQRCGRCFDSQYALSGHMQSHAKEQRKFQCHLCDKAFSESYEDHMKKHKGIKLFVCDIGNAGVRLIDPLRPHKNTQKSDFLCYACGKHFMKKSNLKRHLFLHTGEKKYACTECHKTFNRPDNLNSHKMSHMKDKPYACDICGAAFRQKYQREKHKMWRHNDDKLHKCKFCDVSFDGALPLHYHMRIHTDEKDDSIELQREVEYNDVDITVVKQEAI